MDNIVKVIVEGEFVEYVPREDALEAQAVLQRQLDTALSGKKKSDEESRRAEGRLDSFKMLLTRVFEKVGPADKGWILSIPNPDMQEIRAILDLRADGL